jgi:4-hydroxythreonine-4-phosphate dehydrogenase
MPTAIAPATAVTMGEPAGVGIEITLKAWLLRQEPALDPFFLIADVDEVSRCATALDLDVPVARIENVDGAAASFSTSLPVLHQPLPVNPVAGSPDPANAPAVLGPIETAVTLTMDGGANAVVTNPIQKESLAKAGFRFSGHTDFLGHLAGDVPTVMMLATNGLRVVPATVHVGLQEAISSITPAMLVDCARMTANSLRDDFGIKAPRLVMTGLNPHAGEGGLFGFEEGLIIAPAIDQLNAEGIDIRGPIAADSLFHAAARETYDAAICMYHDQALIPIKTLDFEHAVNTTLGLPFVRTSPDHGTALDIAGKNRANPSSLIAAIGMAQTIARNREQRA